MKNKVIFSLVVEKILEGLTVSSKKKKRKRKKATRKGI